MSTFKKTKVVMLPTNEKAAMFISKKTPVIMQIGDNKVTNEFWEGQHLYFLSDEAIKEGDFAYNIVSKTIDIFTKSLLQNKQYYKKIIATTDKSLSFTWRDNKNDLHIYHLPQPSQSFIEKFVEEYNKGNVITEVLVEYYYSTFGSNKEELTNNEKLVPKINPKDNTITIRKAKDSWSREEFIYNIKLFAKQFVANTETAYKQADIDKWIEENI